jgi:hypothetical protein
MKKFLALSIALLISACAVHKQDGITSSDDSKIAIINFEPCKNMQCLIVKEVDGKWPGVGWITRYELLPGTRRLTLIFAAGRTHSKSEIIIEFDARAGSTYGLRSNADFSTLKWSPDVVDIATGRVVSRQVGTTAD